MVALTPVCPVYLLLIFMAEKVCTASDALVIVEKQLNCFVCCKNFTHLKYLPCLHGFCEICLETLPSQADQDGDVVKCPVCNTLSQVPKDIISNFPDQFLLRDLGDLHQLLRKIAENQKVTCESCDRKIQPWDSFNNVIASFGRSALMRIAS